MKHGSIHYKKIQFQQDKTKSELKKQIAENKSMQDTLINMFNTCYQPENHKKQNEVKESRLIINSKTNVRMINKFLRFYQCQLIIIIFCNERERILENIYSCNNNYISNNIFNEQNSIYK